MSSPPKSGTSLGPLRSKNNEARHCRVAVRSLLRAAGPGGLPRERLLALLAEDGFGKYSIAVTMHRMVNREIAEVRWADGRVDYRCA